MKEHTEWLDSVAGGDSLGEVARTAKVPVRTLYNQREKNRITAENVIAIAIAYNHHPVGALVDTGYLEEKWAQQIDPMRALREVSEDALADEVLSRMNRGGALDMPIDELVALRRQEFDEYFKETVDYETHDDLAKRRHTTSEEPPHVYSFPYDEAVADSSPDEEEGDDHDYYA